MTAAPLNPKWTYESIGGHVHPVKMGQVWRVATRDTFHIFVCTDFMTDEGHALLQSHVHALQPTLLFCDPPWGQNLVNQFRTKAGLEKASYTWQDLYRRIIGYARPSVPIWLESGNRERPKVLREVLHGRPNVMVYDGVYYKKHPFSAYYTGPTPPPLDVTGMDDEDIPLAVLQSYPKGLVFDPCAGKGITPAAAGTAGWSSLSCDLNPWRQSAALVRLCRITGGEPERIA